MTVLKTLHDTETGDPTRIKYDGDTVYVGLTVNRHGEGYIAIVDCVGAYDIHDTEDTAFVDLDEFEHALATVETMDIVDAVQLMGIKASAGRVADSEVNAE